MNKRGEKDSEKERLTKAESNCEVNIIYNLFKILYLLFVKFFNRSLFYLRDNDSCYIIAQYNGYKINVMDFILKNSLIFFHLSDSDPCYIITVYNAHAFLFF